MIEPREAAVILAIFADPPNDVIFIERATHLRNHPGQIGLPGGSAEAVDRGDPVATALRELQEELGVAPERVTVVQRLASILNGSKTFAVTPIVGIVQPKTKLTIDHTETAGVFTVPLEAIVSPGAVHEGIEIIGELRRQTYILDYGDKHIWGLTARILQAFVAAWNEAGSTLRGRIEPLLLR